MQQELQSLLKKGEWPNKNQIAILLAIIKQDALMLATLAFVAKQTVQLAMQTVNLPVNLPIVLTAEEEKVIALLEKDAIAVPETE